MIALSQRHELRDADATGAWLAVITRNVGMQIARKTCPPAELLKAYASEVPDTVGSRRTLEEDLRNARLQSAVHSLPEIQRTILLCRVVDEMSVKDTAATVGCAPGTVKSCLHRTLRALRSQLMVQPTTTVTVLASRNSVPPAAGDDALADLSAVRVRGADGAEHALVAVGEPVLVLLFDPDCTHSRRIAPEWRAWLDGAHWPARVVALSAAPASVAAAHAVSNGWSVPVVTVKADDPRSWEHALTSRTPWVFALDSTGRILAQAHGSRLSEVAAVLAVAEVASS